MIWHKEIILVATSLAVSSGCLCQGICTKRDSELCCPTDVRKTHFWCFGEDAIIHGPCGPKEELYGYERTQWREFPDCENACYGTDCGQPVQPVTPPQQCWPASESPPNASGAAPSNPFQNDPLPTERPKTLPSSQSIKPANQSPQSSTPEPQTLNPVPSGTITESQAVQPNPVPSIALDEPQVETSDGIRQEWSDDVDIRRMEGARRPYHAVAQTSKALKFLGQPLIESSIAPDELERRRSFTKSASSEASR